MSHRIVKPRDLFLVPLGPLVLMFVLGLSGCQPEKSAEKRWAPSARDLTRATVIDIYIKERIDSFKHEGALAGAATAGGDFYESLRKEANETFPPGDYMSLAADDVGWLGKHRPEDFGYVEVWASTYTVYGGTVHKKTVFYCRKAKE